MKKQVKRNYVLCLAIVFLTFLLAFLSAFGCSCNEEPQAESEPFSLNYHSVELKIYESVKLRVKKYNNVAFVSANESVATVSEDGTVTACGFGETVITATEEDKSDSCTITVTDDGAVPKLELNIENKEISVIKSGEQGDSFELKPYVSFNGTNYYDGKMTYTVENGDVASVDENGVITALGYGKTDVTVKAEWRGFDAKYTTEIISVNVCHDVSIKLSLSNDVIYTVTDTINGESYKNSTVLNEEITIDGKPVGAGVGKKYDYSDSIISIDNGNVTAKTFGSTEIVVTVSFDGTDYVANPVKIEVLRPTVKSDKPWVMNVTDNSDKTISVDGEVIECLIGETNITDKTSVSGGQLTIPYSVISGEVGEKNVSVKTAKYIYEYDAVFATHVINDLVGLKTYLDGYTQESSEDDYVAITADIDCGGYKFSGKNRWYKGHINGLGHSIKNYDADKYGLIGGKLVEGPVIENIALFFSTDDSDGVALAECAWNIGTARVYLKNVYVSITSETTIKGLLYRDKDNEGQCLEINNMIIDVSNAQVDYALNKSTVGTIKKLEECYAVGKPSSGKVIESDGSSANTGVLCETQQTLYAEYATAITSANGFNKYWSVKEDGIYFSGTRVVCKNPVTVKNTVYKKDGSISLSEYASYNDITAVSVNNQQIDYSGMQINLGSYTVGADNVIEIILANEIIQIPFVRVTDVITSGTQFNNVIKSFYNGYNDSKKGGYYVLGEDIKLSPTSTKNGVAVWSVDANTDFNYQTFNGLGHSIDCSDVTISDDGIFGDIRFSTIQNVAIINAKANSGRPILASNAWLGTTVENVYAECDYNGGLSAGLLLRGMQNTVRCCVVKTTNATTEGSYAHTDCKNNVINGYVIGCGPVAVNLSGSGSTAVYSNETEFYVAANDIVTKNRGFNEYWKVTSTGVYFGNVLVAENK